MWRIGLALAILGTVSSTAFLCMVLGAALRYRRLSRRRRLEARQTPERALPPVTILKPLHGIEPRLAENLESFFRQDYPDFEIIIGVRDANNPAFQVAKDVQQRYPQIKSRLVLSGPPKWPSAKVFSLNKMIAVSRNSYFVISDSDVLVSPDFLRNTVPPLLDSKNG